MKSYKAQINYLVFLKDLKLFFKTWLVAFFYFSLFLKRILSVLFLTFVSFLVKPLVKSFGFSNHRIAAVNCHLKIKFNATFHLILLNPLRFYFLFDIILIKLDLLGNCSASDYFYYQWKLILKSKKNQLMI